MSQTQPSRRVTQRAPRVIKYLCVKLSPEDEKALTSGVAALRAMGFAVVRNRSDFVRYAIHRTTSSYIETAKRLVSEP